MRSTLLSSAAAFILLATPANAESNKGARVSACMFEHGTYKLVEQDGDRSNATLQFRPFQSVTGIAATMTTPGGAEVKVTLSFSNGYVVNYAGMEIGEYEISPTIAAYTEDMRRARISADVPAPAYVMFPQAGFEAHMAQRAEDDPVEIPDGAWRLVGCNR